MAKTFNKTTMKDYKNTLNLPTTEFPMKANLPQREPEILAAWESMDLYQRLRGQRKGKEKFILSDGPIYANGNIHVGHALNRILKDIVVKSRTLDGFDSPFIPGWDCHGLPVEINVEKKLGKAGVDISPQDFRKACRDYANSQINIQREEFKRLGIIGDWQHPYLTMDFSYEANVIRALAKMIENGYLTQGFKPVYWCLDCHSALAEAEVEYANKISPAIDVRFRVINEAEFFERLNIKKIGKGPISVPIWTTTPWTLPANEAVALNPEFEYVLLQVKTNKGDERLLLAEQLMTDSLKRYGVENYQELGRAMGEAFENILLRHPFYDRQVPIVLGDYVTAETGTGAVHTAPAHGQDDFIIGEKYKLPLANPVGTDGRYLANVPLLAGEHVRKVDNKIIEILTEHKNLLAQNKIEHSYPHCWRHKTALIFLATPQWFIMMENTYRHNAIHAAELVHWIPEWGFTNMASMISKRPDWCISRQRNWGTPITLLIHKQTRKLHPDTVKLMHVIADKVEKQGLETWFNSTSTDWLDKDANNYEKVTDILDVWFDSGVAHFCVLEQRPELHFPADVILEGSDQYRGWFQSLLLTSVAMQTKLKPANALENAKAPYKTVITHGFTVDEKGHKMSKSLGNVIPPEKVINNLGADILRLWVSSTDYTHEIPLSDEILKRMSEAYRRIRNTARYFLSNLFDFDPQQHSVPTEKMLSLDRWAIQRAQLLQQEVIKAYNEYNFHLIYQALHNFCISDMGGFYLDIIKDRQYTLPKNSLARRSAQTAMHHIAEAMVRWIAPILSFTAEEIWKFLPGKRETSVFLAEWYKNLTVKNADAFWPQLMQVREAVNKEIEKCRDEGELGSSLEAEVKIYADLNSKIMQILKTLQNELRFVLITSAAEILPDSQKFEDAVLNTVDGENFWIKVTASEYLKCARCWHRRADVGKDSHHPEICLRCVENIEDPGETRQFA